MTVNKAANMSSRLVTVHIHKVFKPPYRCAELGDIPSITSDELADGQGMTVIPCPCQDVSISCYGRGFEWTVEGIIGGDRLCGAARVSPMTEEISFEDQVVNKELSYS
jgi:hypothetical protein